MFTNMYFHFHYLITNNLKKNNKYFATYEQKKKDRGNETPYCRRRLPHHFCCGPYYMHHAQRSFLLVYFEFFDHFMSGICKIHESKKHMQSLNQQ